MDNMISHRIGPVVNEHLQNEWSQVVKQRAILSRLWVETASNSFHLGM